MRLDIYDHQTHEHRGFIGTKTGALHWLREGFPELNIGLHEDLDEVLEDLNSRQNLEATLEDDDAHLPELDADALREVQYDPDAESEDPWSRDADGRR